jgi:hypothetical protein
MRVGNYKSEWDKHGSAILSGLCDITQLEFHRDVIDVYIVSGNPRQFSNPIVMKCGFSPLEFVNELTHELIHRLFVLNRLKKSMIELGGYMSESDLVKDHILLHALLKYVYLDILNDESRLKINIDGSALHSTNEYSRAWEIVEVEGYMNIINEFKTKLKMKTQ